MVIYAGPQLVLPYAGLCVCMCEQDLYDGSGYGQAILCHVHEHLKRHKKVLVCECSYCPSVGLSRVGWPAGPGHLKPPHTHTCCQLVFKFYLSD